MNRRLLAALTGFALLLTGCSNSSGSDNSSSNTITFYASTDYKDAYDALINDFRTANPGVTVNATYAKTDDIQSTQPTQLQSGGGADVLSVQPGQGGNTISEATLAKAGYLVDLSDRAWASKIPASLKSVTDYDNKTYMFPGVLQPLGAFYNTQAVQGAGLKIPTTWAQVLSFCRDAQAKGKVAFSLGLSDTWVTQLVPYALAPTLVYAQNPNWNADLTAGKATFPDSAWKTVEQQYLDMKNANCFTNDPNGVSFDNTLPPVAKGQALAIVQVGGVFGNLQQQNTAVTYDLQPLPATDDPNATAIAASPGVGLGVNAKSKNKELALRFVDFVAQDTNINKFATTLGGVVPAIPNSAFTVSPVLKTFNELVTASKVSAFPDTGWPNARIQNAHLVGIQNMFLGKKTPAQVLQDMQAQVK
ncbi:extracellular solute-binding protein [Actinoplanes sp. TBRC 11911]|uniref:ABC transporter substrate-binding protein n=1 Tax=Actinoplanes sp. TBRC 11911 TaxID=2729386 RepID=UPI00145D7D17|nr:extracellular solute-binding protein [Actinoplanes sp. TBRC 11911]NMO56836.1 extracellular solute-binding protein [Actinoplanes sp. TBRC 11911]